MSMADDLRNYRKEHKEQSKKMNALLKELKKTDNSRLRSEIIGKIEKRLKDLRETNQKISDILNNILK
jgi:hypothetical protein